MGGGGLGVRVGVKRRRERLLRWLRERAECGGSPRYERADRFVWTCAEMTTAPTMAPRTPPVRPTTPRSVPTDTPRRSPARTPTTQPRNEYATARTERVRAVGERQRRVSVHEATTPPSKIPMIAPGTMADCHPNLVASQIPAQAP